MPNKKITLSPEYFDRVMAAVGRPDPANKAVALVEKVMDEMYGEGYMESTRQFRTEYQNAPTSSAVPQLTSSRLAQLTKELATFTIPERARPPIDDFQINDAKEREVPVAPTCGRRKIRLED